MSRTIVVSDATYAELAALFAPTPGTPPAQQPPGTPAPSVANTYPLARLSVDDKKWLLPMTAQYRQDLKAVPGSHQLFEDLLTDAHGKTVWQGATIQTQINQVKNDVSAGGSLYDPGFDAKTYAGPLKAIYATLVASKKGP